MIYLRKYSSIAKRYDDPDLTLNIKFGYVILPDMYKRTIEKLFLKSVRTFPVIILTGVRQSID